MSVTLGTALLGVAQVAATVALEKATTMFAAGFDPLKAGGMGEISNMNTRVKEPHLIPKGAFVIFQTDYSTTYFRLPVEVAPAESELEIRNSDLIPRRGDLIVRNRATGEIITHKIWTMTSSDFASRLLKEKPTHVYRVVKDPPKFDPLDPRGLKIIGRRPTEVDQYDFDREQLARSIVRPTLKDPTMSLLYGIKTSGKVLMPLIAPVLFVAYPMSLLFPGVLDHPKSMLDEAAVAAAATTSLIISHTFARPACRASLLGAGVVYFGLRHLFGA